jgi:hypothetical protein
LSGLEWVKTCGSEHGVYPLQSCDLSGENMVNMTIVCQVPLRLFADAVPSKNG